MKKIIAWSAGALAVVLGVGAYVIWKNNETRSDTALNDEVVKQLVEDYSAKRLTAQSASISSHRLVVNTGEGNITYILPKNEFFVSIAPFVNSTHPCAVHNLTGCKGEMANESFKVTVTDQTGKTVLSRSMVSHPNGFIDLWLPRDNTYNVTVENGEKRAQSRITTFENDNTCITTMQLG